MICFVNLSILISILISDIPSTTKTTYHNFNTNIAVDSQKENTRYLGKNLPKDSFQLNKLTIAFVFGVSVLLPILFFGILNRRKVARRIESRSRENTTLPFHQRHFGNTEVEGTSTSSPSNFVQIPIEAPGLNQIESVSNSRVSDNPIESTDPRFLPPPSYEEVIATNESTEEPPPTYLESQNVTKFATCLALIFEQGIQIDYT